MKSKKSGFSKILTNSWVITLTATLVGVFVALYLNEWKTSRALNHQKSIATKNILIEINTNKEYLSGVLSRHEELLEIMDFLGKYLDEDDKLIAPSEAYNLFTNNYPDYFVLFDSTFVEDGIYEYDVELNLDMSFPHLELTNINWKTLKNSGIISSYDYECLLYLETVDKVTSEVEYKNKNLLDFFTGSRDSGNNNQNLINYLKLLIQFEESLIDIYNSSEEKLKNCKK